MTGIDVVGDLHGCSEELNALLATLGYHVIAQDNDTRPFRGHHPDNRVLCFVGDLIDRGPDPVGVLSTVLSLVQDGVAECCLGNHCGKLLRWLKGNPVVVRDDLAETIRQVVGCGDVFRHNVQQFLAARPSHVVLSVPGEATQLVVSHAGIPRERVGVHSKSTMQHCLYGETHGFEPSGKPIRGETWCAGYPDDGLFLAVYGHTVVPEPQWIRNTLNIDTGCAFGGALTAFRFPERTFVQVQARRTYRELNPQGS